MEVLAGCRRESTAAAPGAGFVIGSPFKHTLIKHLQEQARRPYGLLITELQNLLSLDKVLEKQSPIHVVLTGHYSPIKLTPLFSETDLRQMEAQEPVDIKPGLKALFSVSFYGEVYPDIAEYVQWLNTQRLKQVYKIEFETFYIEAAFESCSSLMLLSLPIFIWAQLQAISGFSLVGFVKSGNFSLETGYAVKEVISRWKRRLLRPLTANSESTYLFCRDPALPVIKDVLQSGALLYFPFNNPTLA